MADGTQLAINNSIDDVASINRVGKIIDAPKGTSANKGELLLFHHNICRSSWGLKSKRRPSVFCIRENIYYIPYTEVFMIMRQGETEWEAIDPVVFVEPIPAEATVLTNGLIIEEVSYKGTKPLMGRMAYPNKTLLGHGVKKGDLVSFQQDSEHEYKIQGKIYYKMKTQDILAIL
jgi:co-chaperonin GroES (HSP10)